MPTVLIVDDDPIVRNLVRMTLSYAGYAVMDANGAGEAETLCRSLGDQQVDLLIVDHRLADGTGREFAEGVQKLRAPSKVLVISGWPYEHVMKEKGLPVDGSFLQKPFTPHQILTAVEQVLFPSTQ